MFPINAHLTLDSLIPQGTSMEQDSRFYNKDKKLLKSMKFPPNINKKVVFNLLFKKLVPICFCCVCVCVCV